jgi:archaellum component FlaF (FlaF/FlaG flagellin family)
VVAFVMGAVLLGTGVAVSAQTSNKAAATANKKVKKTTTTTAPTTTTTAPCTPKGATVTAVPGVNGNTGTATVVIDKVTCLVNGTMVHWSATGLLPLSGANSLGTSIECNSDPNQPTVTLLGNKIPVSCSNALGQLFTPNSAGTASGTFTIAEGTTGPPAPGKDSNGVGGNIDAALYPCPPTTAQTNLSPPDQCVLAVADTGGDRVIIPLSFNLGAGVVPPVVPTTIATAASGGGTPTTAAKAAKKAATKASSGSLAFTGTGPGLWWLALVGLLLMVFGGLLLTVVDQPRRLIRLVLQLVTRSRHDT